MYHFSGEFNRENESSLINKYKKFTEKIPEIYKKNEKIAEINSIILDLDDLYKTEIDDDLHISNEENLEDNIDNDFYIVGEKDIKGYVPEKNKFNKKKPSFIQKIKNFFKKLFNIGNKEEQIKELNNDNIFNEASNSNIQLENNIRQQRRQEFEKNTQQNKEQETEGLHI